MISTLASLVITFTVAVSAAVALWTHFRAPRLERGAVPGIDVFARAFVELGREGGDPLVAGIAWILISSLVSFGVPVLAKRGQFVLEPSELIIMLDYCLFVPMLVGAYTFLIRSLGFFEATHIAAAGGGPPLHKQKGFWIYQLCLLAVTLLIQYQAIVSEIAQPSPCSPWVSFKIANSGLAWPCGLLPEGSSAAALSVPGVLYYALRGVDTLMALGLVSTVAATWFRARERFKGVPLVDFHFPGLGPSQAAKNVGSGLLAAILFGSIITALHGLSLMAYAKALGGKSGIENAAEQVELFTNSTWALWAVLTIITSAMAIATVLWLHRAVLAELRELQTREEEKYASCGNQLHHKPATVADAGRQVEYIDKLLTVRSKIVAEFATAETWPLPAGALALVSVAALSQMLNIATAVYTFAMKGVYP